MQKITSLYDTGSTYMHICSKKKLYGVVGLFLPLSLPGIAVADSSSEIAQLRAEIQELREILNLKQTQIVSPSTINPATEPAPKASVLKSDMSFNLYGYIRADASYQMKGASTMYNAINTVPLQHSNEAQQQADQFRTTVNVTRLGMDFKVPIDDQNLSAKLELDFFGGATRDQFRIRHAYLNYGDWLVGQTWSNFIAPEYLPETIDAATYVGGALQRTPLVKYTRHLSDHTSFAFSAEDPKYTATSDPEYKTSGPALVGRLNHAFNQGAKLSARTFMAQKKTYADDALAWGIGIGGTYLLTERTQFKADYYHVKGDGRFILWTNSAYALDDQHNMHLNEFDVFSLGLTHQFTTKLRSTIGYGYMRAEDSNEFAQLQHNNSNQNKSLWQGWVNAMYSPITPISFGVEYVYGERETFNAIKGQDNRFNLTAIYQF